MKLRRPVVRCFSVQRHEQLDMRAIAPHRVAERTLVDFAVAGHVTSPNPNNSFEKIP